MTLGPDKGNLAHFPLLKLLFIRFKCPWNEIQRHRDSMKEVMHERPGPGCGMQQVYHKVASGVCVEHRVLGL